MFTVCADTFSGHANWPLHQLMPGGLNATSMNSPTRRFTVQLSGASAPHTPRFHTFNLKTTSVICIVDTENY
eukprot:COSAG04_NODE_21580_length_371_cov_0.753676_1_plen_72_part_00